MELRDCGNGVWLFENSNVVYPVTLFCKKLVEFKGDHPDLIITAIAPYVFGSDGVNYHPETRTVAYIVNTEKR